MATMTVPEAEAPVKGAKPATKYVYSFGCGKADGNGKMKDVLGGKGAGLAEMSNAGLPVPPGFTIQTEACREYMRKGGVSEEVDRQMDAALRQLEDLQGACLRENPSRCTCRKFLFPKTERDTRVQAENRIFKPQHRLPHFSEFPFVFLFVAEDKLSNALDIAFGVNRTFHNYSFSGILRRNYAMRILGQVFGFSRFFAG